jgi:hypothetical protein
MQQTRRLQGAAALLLAAAALAAPPALADARWNVMDDDQCHLTWRSNGDIDYRLCRFWDFVAVVPTESVTLFIRKDGLRCYGSLLRVGNRMAVNVAAPCNDSFTLENVDHPDDQGKSASAGGKPPAEATKVAVAHGATAHVAAPHATRATRHARRPARARGRYGACRPPLSPWDFVPPPPY